MNFLALFGIGRSRKRYEELPDDVFRIIISYLDRRTLLSLMATSRVMRKRIQSFGIPFPLRKISQFTISIRQRDLRLCTRDDPAVCRLRAKSENESIDILLTERTMIVLQFSLIGLVGRPKRIPAELKIQEILQKISRSSKMDLENVRFLCDIKPFRFQFGNEDVDRKRILMTLEAACKNC